MWPLYSYVLAQTYNTFQQEVKSIYFLGEYNEHAKDISMKGMVMV